MRLIVSTRKSEPISPLIRALHWLASSGADPVPAMRSDLSLPSRLSSIIPCRQSTPCRRRRWPPSLAFRRHTYSSSYSGRACLSGGGTAAKVCSSLPPSIRSAPSGTEDVAFPVELPLTLSLCWWLCYHSRLNRRLPQLITPYFVSFLLCEVTLQRCEASL